MRSVGRAVAPEVASDRGTVREMDASEAQAKINAALAQAKEALSAADPAARAVVEKALSDTVWAAVTQAFQTVAKAQVRDEATPEDGPGVAENARGAAAWALVGARFEKTAARNAAAPSVQEAAPPEASGDRLFKALARARGALGVPVPREPDAADPEVTKAALRAAWSPVQAAFAVEKAGDFDESTVIRDEHGKFIAGAKKAAQNAEALGKVVAGKVITAAAHEALLKKIDATLKTLPPEQHAKALKKLEMTAAAAQRAKDFHARAGKNYLVKGAGDIKPEHAAHEVAMAAAINASRDANSLSAKAELEKTPEVYRAAADAHEAARQALVDAIKTESATNGKHGLAGVDALVNAANAHNEANGAAIKAALRAEADAAKAAAPAPPDPVVSPPEPPNPLEDPKALCVWGDKGVSADGIALGPPAPTTLNGVPLNSEAGGFWKHTQDVEVGEGPMPTGSHISTGCIVMEPDGRMWVYEPKGHFGGAAHTWPKGKMDAGESLTPQQNALKEVHEESGLKVRIVGLMGDYKGSVSTTRYYIAQRVGGDPRDGLKAPPGGMAETQAVKLTTLKDAAGLLNMDRDKKILAELGPKLAKQPELLSRDYAPPVKSVGTTVLGTKTGGAAGSNALGKSGFWTGTDGVQRYVKEYANPAQAHVEHLANQLYNDLGVKAPESRVFQHEGKTLYASTILPGGKPLGLSPSKGDAREVARGFAADVFLANRDALGYSGDNVLKLPDGSIARIDNGGALLFKAQGGDKPGKLEVGELTSSFDKSVAPQYAKVLEAAGVKNAFEAPGFRQQVERITKLAAAPGGWAKYVQDRVPDLAPKDHAKVVEMLETRGRLLKEASDAYEASKPKPVAPPEKVLSLKNAIDGGAHDKVAAALAALPTSSAKQDKAITAVNKEVGLSWATHDAIKSIVSSWTSSGHSDGGAHGRVYAAFADVTEKGAPRQPVTPDTKATMAAAVETRAARWKAMLTSSASTHMRSTATRRSSTPSGPRAIRTTVVGRGSAQWRSSARECSSA